MKRFSILFVCLCIGFLATLAGCGKKQPQTADPLQTIDSVHSIVALPVEIQKSDQGYDYVTTRQLEAGAATLEELLREVLEERGNVQFLAPARRESLLADFQGGAKATALHVGNQTGADAVLMVTVIRFSERDGGEYAVNQPASVSFKYQLFHTATGTTLCMGVFDETQQTLLSNLFTFSKASSRGFKWITARELAEEGLREKFNACRYLAD